ncbi:MAG: polyprenol phosphomannose-dependent alpha 1,6 mannosyltransferase MptB [Thermomicrobiales bacterium]|nr:polyprenol phosphomannose-dependent alpha 1,6 mannosyltransferase MptB [Thermomicrobiales bacterium]
MQDDRVVSRSAVPPALPAVEPRSLVDQVTAIAIRVSPLRLGFVQVLFTFLLSTLMLSLPARQPGFMGVVNNANGPRAYHRLFIWRNELGPIGERLSGLGVSPDYFIWFVRGSHVILALIQVLAIWALVTHYRRTRSIESLWKWLAGPVLSLAVFLVYPALCSDVMFYITSGAIANSGGNPYSAPIRVNFDAPLLYLNDWAGIASPYGPVWTGLCRIIVGIFGDSFLVGIFGFRFLAIASVGTLLYMVYRLTMQLLGDRNFALGAVIALAWMPSLLFETATGAHNDAIMFSLALGGLLVMTSRKRGGTRLGIALITLSALLKYVTIPILGFALLWRLADRKRDEPITVVIKRWSLDGIMIVALAIGAYGPYWDGPRIFDSLIAQPTRGVSTSLWILPHKFTEAMWGYRAGQKFDNVLGYVTLGFLVPVFILTFIWLWKQMNSFHGESGLNDEGVTRDRRLLVQLQAWMIPAGLLPTIPVDGHNWYMIWAMGPFFILAAWLTKRLFAGVKDQSAGQVPGWIDRLGPARITALFLAWSIFNVLMYHTRTLG